MIKLREIFAVVVLSLSVSAASGAAYAGTVIDDVQSYQLFPTLVNSRGVWGIHLSIRYTQTSRRQEQTAVADFSISPEMSRHFYASSRDLNFRYDDGATTRIGRRRLYSPDYTEYDLRDDGHVNCDVTRVGRTLVISECFLDVGGN